MAGVHPVAWDTLRGSGRRLTVLWWSGVAPCNVLDRVAVRERARRVTITLYEGHDPSAGRDLACIEIAQRKAATVELRRPLGERRVVDGAKR